MVFPSLPVVWLSVRRRLARIVVLVGPVGSHAGVVQPAVGVRGDLWLSGVMAVAVGEARGRRSGGGGQTDGQSGQSARQDRGGGGRTSQGRGGGVDEHPHDGPP